MLYHLTIGNWAIKRNAMILNEYLWLTHAVWATYPKGYGIGFTNRGDFCEDFMKRKNLNPFMILQ
ncbi:hypothetical protein CXB36_21545 [Pseudomonas syringae pv. syringae]|nr:hypothetical protein BKC06_009880 [Pseudomonas syringae pv. syringae]KWS15260.1 hypothetical protein AL063_00330 [Pseudomonas syringae pv. syringae]POD59757.1 hypothetical protein BKM13_13995 [Pseudomonas syringae pv. syringae]POP63150.1 hypothetical protein CXB36_21545 [Pseudomonas syringae pv. syringae]